MRCPNCQTLNLPNARFCMECGNRLLVCPNCQTVNLPRAKFCIECGMALAEQIRDLNYTQPLPEVSMQEEVQRGRALSTIPLTGGGITANPAASQIGGPEERRVVTIMLSANIIVTTRRSSAASQIGGPEERRVVTIMFADITGSTPLADRLDPEDMRAI